MQAGRFPTGKSPFIARLVAKLRLVVKTSSMPVSASGQSRPLTFGESGDSHPPDGCPPPAPRPPPAPVQLIHRASRPHVALLGRIPGTRRFSDRQRHPDNELIGGVLIFRPESGLVYFNVDHVRDVILHRALSEVPPPKLVVLDLSAAPYIDMQAAHTLAGLADDLTAAGIHIQTVETRSSVRDRLRSEGVEAKLGGVNRHLSVADAVESFQKRNPDPKPQTDKTP